MFSYPLPRDSRICDVEASYSFRSHRAIQDEGSAITSRLQATQTFKLSHHKYSNRVPDLWSSECSPISARCKDLAHRLKDSTQFPIEGNYSATTCKQNWIAELDDAGHENK